MAKKASQVCPKCKKEITTTDYFMLALEKPYRNLFFHKECFQKVEGEVGWEGLAKYISQLLSK